MSQTLTYIADQRGVTRPLDAFVVAAAFDRVGSQAAFALGDGTIRTVDPQAWDGWAMHEAHDGGVLALAADAAPTGFVSGGDDGRFRRLSNDGVLADIAGFGSKWVEHVASFFDGKTALLACAERKNVHVFADGADGWTETKCLAHPSSVAGVTFDGRGKRVAAAHYNGASLWFVGAKEDKPRLLEWKGSHIGVVIHPDGSAVVTAMQENALHGWRLADGQHMRMSGYPAKTAAMSFSRTGKWLATSGADAVVCWPFFGGGPMGKAPLELAGGAGVLCSFVACHPVQDVVAAGFADGMIILADIASQRILPAVRATGSPVSAMAWSPTGTHLAFGTEAGQAGLIDLTRKDA
jgi:WD40 repeat protein